MKFCESGEVAASFERDKTGMIVCFESTAGTEFGTNFEVRLAEPYRNGTVKMVAGPNGTKNRKSGKFGKLKIATDVLK